MLQNYQVEKVWVLGGPGAGRRRGPREPLGSRWLATCNILDTFYQYPSDLGLFGLQLLRSGRRRPRGPSCGSSARRGLGAEVDDLEPGA